MKFVIAAAVFVVAFIVLSVLFGLLGGVGTVELAVVVVLSLAAAVVGYRRAAHKLSP
jgi:membrane protein implicated in regulation of membrane protease activity